MSDLQTEAAAVAHLSANPIKYIEDDQGDIISSVVALRDDYSITDLEHLQPNRRRFRGEFKTRDVGAFFKYIDDAYVRVPRDEDAQVQVFVSEETMSAQAYIDYLSDGLAGHCVHSASIKLPKTPLYKDVLFINGDKMGAQSTAEWIEDHAPHFNFLSANGESIKHADVLAAVRNMTIERARISGHEVAQLKESASLMESSEAKAKIGQVPAYLEFIDPCFEKLEPTPFKMRFGVLTGGDQVAYKFDLINQAELEHDCAVAFAELLTESGDEHVVVRLGTFAP